MTIIPSVHFFPFGTFLTVVQLVARTHIMLSFLPSHHPLTAQCRTVALQAHIIVRLVTGICSPTK